MMSDYSGKFWIITNLSNNSGNNIANIEVEFRSKMPHLKNREKSFKRKKASSTYASGTTVGSISSKKKKPEKVAPFVLFLYLFVFEINIWLIL